MRRVELEARLMRPLRTRRFQAFGEGSILHRPLWIYGPQQIAIGGNSLILHNAWLSVETPAGHSRRPLSGSVTAGGVDPGASPPTRAAPCSEPTVSLALTRR